MVIVDSRVCNFGSAGIVVLSHSRRSSPGAVRLPFEVVLPDSKLVINQ